MQCSGSLLQIFSYHGVKEMSDISFVGEKWLAMKDLSNDIQNGYVQNFFAYHPVMTS